MIKDFSLTFIFPHCCLISNSHTCKLALSSSAEFLTALRWCFQSIVSGPEASITALLWSLLEMQVSNTIPDYLIRNSALGPINLSTPADSDVCRSLRTTELINNVPFTHCFAMPLYPILSSHILHGAISELSILLH